MSKFLEAVSTLGALVMAATPLVVLGSVAHAEPAAVSPARIEVAGLDLRSPNDAATFRHRVSVAATSLCGQAGVQPLSMTLSCHQAVYDEAVSKLGSTQQQDLQAARTVGFTVAAR